MLARVFLPCSQRFRTVYTRVARSRFATSSQQGLGASGQPPGRQDSRTGSHQVSRSMPAARQHWVHRRTARNMSLSSSSPAGGRGLLCSPLSQGSSEGRHLTHDDYHGRQRFHGSISNPTACLLALQGLDTEAVRKAVRGGRPAATGGPDRRHVRARSSGRMRDHRTPLGLQGRLAVHDVPI